MGWCRIARIDCIYKEVDSWLKEQFIHRPNTSEMLAKIIIEFTKSDENMMIPSEQVLVWGHH